jgi:hypothetical protein
VVSMRAPSRFVRRPTTSPNPRIDTVASQWA